VVNTAAIARSSQTQTRFDWCRAIRSAVLLAVPYARYPHAKGTKRPIGRVYSCEPIGLAVQRVWAQSRISGAKSDRRRVQRVSVSADARGAGSAPKTHQRRFVGYYARAASAGQSLSISPYQIVPWLRSVWTDLSQSGVFITLPSFCCRKPGPSSALPLCIGPSALCEHVRNAALESIFQQLTNPQDIGIAVRHPTRPHDG
jgi:hypothetical protein